jgi:hypothetical protein
VSSIQPQQQFREKSPNIKRHSLTNTTTIAVLPTSSANKIDKDILKHASRIRSKSQSKDYSTKSSRIDSMPMDTLSPRNDHSINKPLKSMSLVSYNNLSRIFVYFLSFPDEYNEYQWRETSN